MLVDVAVSGDWNTQLYYYISVFNLSGSTWRLISAGILPAN